MRVTNRNAVKGPSDVVRQLGVARPTDAVSARLNGTVEVPAGAHGREVTGHRGRPGQAPADDAPVSLDTARLSLRCADPGEGPDPLGRRLAISAPANRVP